MHVPSHLLFFTVYNFLVHSEVNIILKLTHLPPFPEYTLDLCAFPGGYGPMMRPVAMEGLAIAMTRITKYTQGARFLCTDDDCPCSTGTYLPRSKTRKYTTQIYFSQVQVAIPQCRNTVANKRSTFKSKIEHRIEHKLSNNQQSKKVSNIETCKYSGKVNLYLIKSSTL